MKLITTILLVFFFGLSFSQSYVFNKVDNGNEIAQKLNIESQKIKSLKSDFKQYKHLDILENDIESTGRFNFQADDKVRWEYITPYKYLIIMNAGTMWIQDGNKTQKYDAESNKMFKEINDLMVGMLDGKILGSNNFTVSFFENNKQVLAKLQPKTNELKEFLSGIHLYFEKKDYSVTKIKMLEHSGDYTLIEFYNKKLNVEIPKSKFLLR